MLMKFLNIFKNYSEISKADNLSMHLRNDLEERKQFKKKNLIEFTVKCTNFDFQREENQ